MELKITKTEKVEFTPELLAACFWEMDSEAQREFFDELGRLSNVGNGDFETQMSFVRARNISQRALNVMEVIGGNSN